MGRGLDDAGEVDAGGRGVRSRIAQMAREGALVTITPEERARRAAWVGAVTDAELRRRTLEEYSRRARSRSVQRDSATRCSQVENFASPLRQLPVCRQPRSSTSCATSSASARLPSMRSATRVMASMLRLTMRP